MRYGETSVTTRRPLRHVESGLERDDHADVALDVRLVGFRVREDVSADRDECCPEGAANYEKNEVEEPDNRASVGSSGS